MRVLQRVEAGSSPIGTQTCRLDPCRALTLQRQPQSRHGRPSGGPGACGQTGTAAVRRPPAGQPRRLVTPEGGSVSHGYWWVPVPPEDRHLVPPGRHADFEHRLVLARLLGRPLLPDETVHHRNGDRLDNRVDNLELWSSAQPKGQRIEDKLAWAHEIIRRYDPDAGGDLDPETGLPLSWVAPEAGQPDSRLEPETDLALGAAEPGPPTERPGHLQ